MTHLISVLPKFKGAFTCNEGGWVTQCLHAMFTSLSRSFVLVLVKVVDPIMSHHFYRITISWSRNVYFRPCRFPALFEFEFSTCIKVMLLYASGQCIVYHSIWFIEYPSIFHIEYPSIFHIEYPSIFLIEHPIAFIIEYPSIFPIGH